MIAPLHLGALHPFEQIVVFLLAFGPFVVLGLVIHRQRKRSQDEEDEPGDLS